MHIAVISDTHNQRVSVANALKIVASRNVDAILHCGDIQDGDTVRMFPRHTHFVFGNCDSDHLEIQAAVAEIGATMHGAWGQLELAGRSLAFVHGDDRRLFQDLENADAFDFLFYGHSHLANEHRTGRTRVVNPGALHRVSQRTFLIVDLATGDVESIVVE